MSPANLVVELDVRPAEADAFVAMFLREFVARSRGEPGCLIYDLWIDEDRRGRMVIVESWATPADLDRHLAREWFAEWAPRLEAAQATPPVVRRFGAAGPAQDEPDGH